MGLAELKRDLGFAAGVLRRRPFQVLLQVTNRCNMRCSFCTFPQNAVAPEEEMTLDDYRRLERDLAAVGSRFMVSLEGGEPFVRPDLVEIVRLFAARHLPILYTNGWYVDAAAARALFEAGLTQVGVSIDYPDPARHDRKRGLAGATERAWRAIDRFREAAPHGGKQVHVMTVLTEDNWRDLGPLLEQSAARAVCHCVTLLSTRGVRRGGAGSPDRAPDGPVSETLLALWRRHPHFKIFREYLELMDPFLGGGAMPACRAGTQSFNIDHVGNVAPCIEKIDRPAGNVRREPLREILGRMASLEGVAGCNDCWTACRGMNQILGAGGGVRGWWDLATRMRSS